jgi:hypothetical protein
MAGAGLFWEKSSVGWLLMAGLLWEKSTAGSAWRRTAHSPSHLIHCHVTGAHGNLGGQSRRATSTRPVPVQEPTIGALEGKPKFQQAARPKTPRQSKSETGADSEQHVALRVGHISRSNSYLSQG